MKILIVNKFLYPKGGSETYIFKLGTFLQSAGHEIQYFGMEHEGRIVGNRAESYTSNMDFHGGSKMEKLLYPAIRYAAGFEDIVMVLSGMSNMEQMEDNISYMADFKPLSEEEHAIIDKVRTLYQAQHKIPCTACRYCVDGCPAGIPIPDIFALQNAKLGKEGYDESAYGKFPATAADCVECGQCENACPQNLQIRDLLKEVEKSFA